MKAPTLLIDNFDSFTYNLYHHLRALGQEVVVCRNDENRWRTINPSRVVLSPGPGLPDQSHQLMDILAHFCGKIPVLGVCLGHQAIAVSKGIPLTNLQRVRHGMQLEVKVLQETVLFRGLAPQFKAGFYHSWAITDQGLSSEHLSAIDEEEIPMAIEYPEEGLFGIQFHPESIMCPVGMEILRNFLRFT